MAKWPYNTAAWKRLRMSKLASEPLCQPCLLRGVTTMAKAVDHVVPINAGGEPFPPLDGLKSMCERCHNEKTSANDRTDTKPFARKVKGFDAKGNPVDPEDDWHRTGGGSNHEKQPFDGPTGKSRIYLVSGTSKAEDSDKPGVA